MIALLLTETVEEIRDMDSRAQHIIPIQRDFQQSPWHSGPNVQFNSKSNMLVLNNHLRKVKSNNAEDSLQTN